MKVLVDSNPDIFYFGECYACGCMFEATPSEVTEVTKKKVEFLAKCPGCKNQILVLRRSYKLQRQGAYASK